MGIEKQKKEKSGKLQLAMYCTAIALHTQSGGWVLHFLNSITIIQG
jgi:hypothetical protein